MILLLKLRHQYQVFKKKKLINIYNFFENTAYNPNILYIQIAQYVQLIGLIKLNMMWDLCSCENTFKGK